mmetsp:Transcript_21883/g.45185  ORF Transcript_21883/g.45185 Transcript_21883/m.45185 type:complete len:615 (-) Transcript_21883:193-2037(-)
MRQTTRLLVPPRTRTFAGQARRCANMHQMTNHQIRCRKLCAVKRIDLRALVFVCLISGAAAFSPHARPSPLAPSSSPQSRTLVGRLRSPYGQVLLPLSSSSSKSESSSSPKSSSSPSSNNRLKKLTKNIKKTLKLRDSAAENEDTKRREKWLGWMTAGTPRNVDKVMMREAAVLGGLPRSERYSSRDWWHNTVTMPSSSILRDVLSPVMAMTTWAMVISLVHRRLLRRYPLMAGHMCMSSSPHSLMVSALGLLLVFRTNSAYQRFAEGRKIWEGILNNARDLSRMTKLYEDQIGKERRRRVQRLLAAFPYLLRYRIRPSSVKDGGQMRRYGDAATDDERDPKYSLFLYQDMPTKENDFEAAKVASEEEMTGMSRRQKRDLYWVDKRTLPWRLLPGDAMEKCARAQNRPLWICDRMATELRNVPDQDGPIPFTNRERITLVSLVDDLSKSIGSCERIHQTVVPLNYARHALRALTIWLLSLPFALVKDLGLLTAPVIFIISWMLFGIYEIGTRIEDPFQGTLRLSILCDQMRREVLSDELLRDTAFTIDLPQKEEEEKSKVQFLPDGEEDDDDSTGGSYEDGGDDRRRTMWVNGDVRPEQIMRKFMKREAINRVA